MKTRRDEGEIWENDHSRKGGQILKACKFCGTQVDSAATRYVGQR